MPQVRIHISNSIDTKKKAMLVDSVRGHIPSVLQIDDRIGQVILYEAEHRAIHI